MAPETALTFQTVMIVIYFSVTMINFLFFIVHHIEGIPKSLPLDEQYRRFIVFKYHTCLNIALATSLLAVSQGYPGFSIAVFVLVFFGCMMTIEAGMPLEMARKN